MNRLGLKVLKHNARFQRATFSSSSVAQLDLSSLYNKLTGWRKKTPSNIVIDPTLIRDDERSDESMPAESKPRKLKVIGKPKDIAEEREAIKEFVEFSAWPTNHHRRDLKEPDIDNALAQVRNFDFADITSRFQAVKQVTESLRIAVPDPVISTLSSADEFRTHLLRSARVYDERQPDAIYLSPEDYLGTNIVISDPTAERKAMRQKKHELLRKARVLQKGEADEIMQSS